MLVPALCITVVLLLLVLAGTEVTLRSCRE